LKDEASVSEEGEERRGEERRGEERRKKPANEGGICIERKERTDHRLKHIQSLDMIR